MSEMKELRPVGMGEGCGARPKLKTALRFHYIKIESQKWPKAWKINPSGVLFSSMVKPDGKPSNAWSKHTAS